MFACVYRKTNVYLLFGVFPVLAVSCVTIFLIFNENFI